jgi:hypothetical protein
LDNARAIPAAIQEQHISIHPAASLFCRRRHILSELITDRISITSITYSRYHHFVLPCACRYINKAEESCMTTPGCGGNKLSAKLSSTLSSCYNLAC